MSAQTRPSPRWLRRLLRMRRSTVVLLALPGVLLTTWYFWSCWVSLARFRDAVAPQTPISLELFRVHLADQGRQQLRRLRQSLVPAPLGELPEVGLLVKPKRLPSLLDVRHQPFVPAKIEYAGQSFGKAEVRLRGQKHWHVAGFKKSLKIKLQEGDRVLGQPEFQLNNPHHAVLFDEKLWLDLARASGLMTPDSDFVRLRFNGLSLGVFAFQAPAGEKVLRQHQRIPGNLYTLEKAKDWQQAARWEKQAWYDAKNGPRQDLRQLLQQLSQASPGELASFARHALDLSAFASLDALNRLSNNGAAFNFALYFDPYKGQWTPLVFEFEGFDDQDRLNAQNPLLTALERIPGYIAQRNRRVHTLQQGAASRPELQRRGEALIARLARDLEADLYWQANRQLPAHNTLSSQLMRPMNLAHLRRAFADALSGLQTHQQAVLAQLPAVPPAAPAPAVPPEKLSWGPGPVVIPTTRVFAPHQQVYIAPGTQLLLGPGASLIFTGPVQFAGTARQPITLRSAGQGRWGGLVLQGPGTAGSRLHGLDAQGGSRPHWRENSYPGMINLHDSRDLTVSNCIFGDNQGSDDLVHTVYVNGLKAAHNRLFQAASDAWDLEFTQGSLTDIQIRQAGDDGIDLMGVELVIRNSAVIQAKNNGISAGEGSQVHVLNSLIAETGQGVLSKNGASVSLSQSVLYGNRIGLEIDQKSLYYDAPSRLSATGLMLVASETPVDQDKHSAPYLQLTELQSALTPGTAFQRLQQHLGLTRWEDLPNWLHHPPLFSPGGAP
ncbi:MAG: CotH kinase family protein [Candidatus Sericytochromatia bacterium]